MHVISVIVAGMVLLGLFVLFGWLWGTSVTAMALGAKVFLPTWLLIACVNFWVGVTRAGYTFQQEAPILLIVFALPALSAGLTMLWLSRG